MMPPDKQSQKEQFRKDVASIRAEIRRVGGITQKTIDDAIKRYRKQAKEMSNKQ